MKKYLMAATLLASFGTAGAVIAGDDCHVPKADWQAPEAVQAMAGKEGWTVDRIKTDDGCYEIKGQDAQGQKIKVKVDPGTLTIVKFKYDDYDCQVPMTDWQSREAVQAMAEKQGWTVRRIKTDDGCYKIKGTDAQGRKIEAKVDPGTLKIIKFEGDGAANDLGGKPAAKDTGQAPANRVLTPGTKPVVE